LLILISALLMVACAPGPAAAPKTLETTPEGHVVEQAILWEDELDAGWNPLGMRNLLQDKERFEQQETQYLALKPLVVFGHRCAYVGMVGIGSVGGPNATLAGTPKSIADHISRQRGVTFRNKDGVYICDYKPNIRLLIEEHPDLKGGSIIIGAYVGPR